MAGDQTRRAAARPNLPRGFEMPPGACDSHVHIFGDPAQFPMARERSYSLAPALPAELAEMHQRLGIERVVIVTPSVYGTDNSSTLMGIAARGAAARGIALIDAHTSDAELDRLDQGGIRGIRLNLSVSTPETAQRLLHQAMDQVLRRGWHIQILTPAPLIVHLHGMVCESPVPIVFDHFGGAIAEWGIEQPGFPELVDCVARGCAYVKISAAYRQSQQAPDFGNVKPLAQRLIAAHADRILWGSDWPHPDSASVPGRKPTDLSPRIAVNDVAMLQLLATWVPDATTWKKILVDNPARLYRF
jgi:predicted TIM-barrel fold metal-dependent hydrolase